MGLCLALLSLRWFEISAQTQQKNQFLVEQQTFLKHWIDADHQSLLKDTRSIARELSANPSADFFAQLPPSDPSLLWELTPSGEITVHRAGKLQPSAVTLLTTPAFLRDSLRPESGWFYFRSHGDFYHATYAPISPHGNWLLLIREWDPDYLRKLSLLTEGSVSLKSPEQVDTPTSASEYQINHSLNDWRGQPIIRIAVRGHFPFSIVTWKQSQYPVIAFLTFGISVIAALALCLHRWVITPLNQIKTSLISEEIKPVTPYLNRPDEIGRIARLIENTGAQRDALRKSEEALKEALSERSQLGRDLHDGIIQSLYGTGMSLATIQARLPADDAINRASLDQTRASLNEAILDLRNFIIGLEPEALKENTFTSAVMGLMNSSETERKVITRCNIDENLAKQLNITQRAHLLQITREALSNALRHGSATEVSAELLLNGSYVEYRFSDNGHGFTTSPHSTNEGHGLENLANRASDLGATFSVQSNPGQGTQLKLRFPRPRLSNS